MQLTPSLLDSFEKKKSFAIDYFSPWTFEKPFLVSDETNNKIAQLHKILYKLIVEFVTHYNDYKNLMPINDSTQRILSFFYEKPYKIGSFRTDYIINSEMKPQIIEITCRFPFNGFWMSALLDVLSIEKAKQLKIPHHSKSSKFLDFVAKKFHNKEIIILSHKGKGEESRFYSEILEGAGIKVTKVFCDEISPSIFENLEKKIFLTELNQEDYFTLDDIVLEKLSKAEILNDLRTIFLIHDKRFFSVIADDKLRSVVLTKDEISLLDDFYIPTYKKGEREDLWNKARTEKDNWILKHKHLGKSSQIFAGITTSNKEWLSIIDSEKSKDFILQEYIHQPKFKGKIENQHFEDYVVGTMLFFEDQCFGNGLLRASSYPITNVKDDRKVLHLNTSTAIKNFYKL